MQIQGNKGVYIKSQRCRWCGYIQVVSICIQWQFITLGGGGIFFFIFKLLHNSSCNYFSSSVQVVAHVFNSFPFSSSHLVHTSSPLLSLNGVSPIVIPLSLNLPLEKSPLLLNLHIPSIILCYILHFLSQFTTSHSISMQPSSS